MTTRRTTTRLEMFNRILQNDSHESSSGTNPQPVKTNLMITKVTAKPNPFYTALTLDVTCEQNRHIIVRMFNEDGKIIKMFSWYLVKGTNITVINELGNLSSGTFLLDIIDNEGHTLYSTRLNKE